jgi:non-homologous end joining protein Ku
VTERENFGFPIVPHGVLWPNARSVCSVILHTLFYANEVRTEQEWRAEETVTPKRNLNWRRCWSKMEAKFEPNKLNDAFQERLRTLIDSRSTGAVVATQVS